MRHHDRRPGEQRLVGVRFVPVLLVAVLGALTCVLVALSPPAGTIGPATASAASKPDARSTARLDDLVRFLQDTQNDDGGYGGSPGAPSDPMMSAWVGIGLAAAGINPQDQKPPGSKASVASYLERHGPAREGGNPPVTTEFERIGMFVNAAGMNPRRFGGRDYVRLLLARQSKTEWTPPTDGTVPAGARPVPAGWFPHAAGGRTPGINDTIFAVFFLSGVKDPKLRAPIARAAGAIEAMQRPDGTWPAMRQGDLTNVDMTGAAIQALCAARRCETPAVRSALKWLRAHQQPDGGWMSGDLAGETAGQSNSGTTPWVVQALWATGNDPRTWRRGGKDPLSFLATLQRRDGSIRWRQDQDMNPTWMTAYAAPAFAGHPWPVPTAPRAAAVRAKQRKAAKEKQLRARNAAGRGQGGAKATGSGTVAAGGGGRGAELFSRPQPQSQGATAGGVRDTQQAQDEQRGTQGKNGATGTAAASGPGDSGGVENGEQRGATPAGGTEVAGQVVERPRGTQGTENARAIAPGLQSARAGDDSRWGLMGMGAAALLCALLGAYRETRRSRVTV